MDSDIAIVPMGLGHLREVLDLGHESFDTNTKPYTSWSLTSVVEHLDNPDGSCWVALDSDRVVGFVLGSLEFELRDDWAYLEWIAVAPDMQGRGIAGRLVEICCQTMFARGARRIVTDVEAGNTASATMMTRHGFVDATTVTLFVRPNPEEPDLVAEDASPPLTHATKRTFARTGRLRR
ncbi:GNAT family N-acetyltransferase [Nocardia terpenica]|uniref:Acetyltransferase n=1 Tax=Nocardia terpenica TaxID=455432 RepID=A0A164LHW2_9NOCA|nr:GNAT family N-acetyltransferase [Nocardia terpenica]KZM72429.1 acetyltransferase [Nocardia terpenica]MBF6059586.1 GNAT family N-acetyltransferase [Nocardia terpenica]MBF6102875.1 GNAT family N-acetyltransferase [Nocardia terpenica]MBF6110936.1 GNAT family N-acetyltransferase [Nocardia terpenica]MBF6117067.1 GNAT family N-acetyltransferase [Nocardia terpenica]